ncbi:unnamed protein product [Miscanthus lutarioriparius]|uniref:R13L1/DRL21-like LRR repeat region domain-containing protein n=1 Tax=Miscanthus lutarioriparius TaxID=422564 RepID=A0A811R3A2_9POAL|nr:unnamed protein product [Miscanthus lutarioriparius]
MVGGSTEDGGGGVDDHELETFQMIGKQILKKLKGSPLAARVVGARLRKNLKATFWRRVGDQDMLPDTMGALWWSYQHLDGQDEWFTMHDLLHELVVMVSGNDCFRIEGSEMKEFPPDVRHLYVRSKDQVKFTEQICKLQKLRILIFITNIGGQGISVEELEGILENLTKLRVLQILELWGSGVLEFSNLKSLRGLSDFKVRKEKGYELQQLKGMNRLSGSLRISGLDCVESKEVALEARLSDKTDLTALSLEWSGSSGPGQHTLSPDLQVEILEGLCPPSQLAELRVWGYGGWKCPSWLSQSQNISLQYFELCRCYNLKALPQIGDLFIHLGHLKLVSLPKLEKLPRLPNSLKTLDIVRCEALVLTCGADVDMIRSRFIERTSQMEPSLNVRATHAEEIDKFADEQPVRHCTAHLLKSLYIPI